jgi:CO/xanthine dehydrogenase Mo-binding subunit
MLELGSKSSLEAPLSGRFDLSRPGIVMLKTGKVELGQGILLTLRQIAAEELDLTVDAVVTVSGDTSASPFEGGTVGSISVETSGREVRDAAAELRSVLFDAAARKLGVSVSEITANEGQIFVAGSRSTETFWSLAAEISFDRPLGRSALPKSPKLYKTVGTNIPQTHLLERLGGGAFIHDLSFDGMLHGRVLRKPHAHARLESVDADAISGPGVWVVHERDFTELWPRVSRPWRYRWAAWNVAAGGAESQMTDRRRRSTFSRTHGLRKGCFELTKAHQIRIWRKADKPSRPSTASR